MMALHDLNWRVITFVPEWSSVVMMVKVGINCSVKVRPLRLTIDFEGLSIVNLQYSIYTIFSINVYY
jgi:hypothetical protein